MNQGEICLCGSRIYVHRKVYDQIKQRFVEEVSKLKIGDPLNDQTKVGAIVSKPHFDKILGYIDRGQARRCYHSHRWTCSYCEWFGKWLGILLQLFLKV